MKKGLIAVVGLVAVVALIVVFMMGGRGRQNVQDVTPTNQAAEQANSHSDKQGMAGGNNSAASSSEAVETNKVEIKDYEFQPAKITVKKGTTVTWTNQDAVKHDVFPLKESSDFKASELLAKGESYSVTFNTVGTYEYKCSPHPYMKGTVEVVE